MAKSVFDKSMLAVQHALPLFRKNYERCGLTFETTKDEFIVYSSINYLGQQDYLVRICNNENTKVNIQYWSEGCDNISYIDSPLTVEEAEVILEDAIVLDFQRNILQNKALFEELVYLKDNFNIRKLLNAALNSRVQSNGYI